ncbi:tryptophan synthase subunit alpha [Clostridium rectalis]|uniref:tryptophan synthase subunit alpha n=1 Tax=Clostridium rectalis TaxID=2040295 RepID=UPI000F6409FB|nr:tryptophan synthase subunit alpha [Clostridium rectalis]
MSSKLIGYLSYGYPSIEKSIEIANIYAKSGCDVIEISYPTDNAYIDSEYISLRMKYAIEKCNDTKKYFQGISKIRENNPSVQLLLLIYEHSIIDLGVNNFIKYCKDNLIEDIILVGTKDNFIKNKLIEEGLKISCYVTFSMPDSEIKEAKSSNGFVYFQAKPSGKVKEGYETLDKCIKYLKEIGIKTPIYVGVGISTKEDVLMASRAGADGIFVGSAILKKQDDFKELEDFIIELKSGIIK